MGAAVKKDRRNKGSKGTSMRSTDTKKSTSKATTKKKTTQAKTKATPKKKAVTKKTAAKKSPATKVSSKTKAAAADRASGLSVVKPLAEGACPNCTLEANCRRRSFSEEALTVLLLWGEICDSSVDQPICDDCYEEMRDVLIDRADEIDDALVGQDISKVRKIVSKAAS